MSTCATILTSLAYATKGDDRFDCEIGSSADYGITVTGSENR
jgi:hypothetical protein